MSKAVTVVLRDPVGFRRFEKLKHPGGGTSTIVKIIKTTPETTYILKNIKWSRFKLVNKIIKLWLTIKYM